MRTWKVTDYRFSKQKWFGKICSQVKPEFPLSPVNNCRIRKKEGTSEGPLKNGIRADRLTPQDHKVRNSETRYLLQGAKKVIFTAS